MPSMVGAVTRLCVAAVAFSATTDYSKTTLEFARPNDGTFTRVAPGALPGQPWGSFTGKTLKVEDTLPVSDTYLVVMTMGDVSDIDVDVSDTYTVVFTMAADTSLAELVSDTYTPAWTMSVAGLSKTGDNLKPVTDTYTPVLTMTCAVNHLESVTDTYTPVLTMVSSKATSDLVVITDTYRPVLTMSVDLDAVAGLVNWPRSDTYTVVMTDTAALADAGEVDDIRITERAYGIIRIVEV
jgi:hypothetical protein